MPAPGFGMYLVNPAKKHRGARKKSRKARKNPSRSRASRGSPVSTAPAKMKTRRRRKARRNPSSRRRSGRVVVINPTRRRSRKARRNPARRASSRRGFSLRNPVGDVVRDIASESNLKIAGGALVFTTGASIVINKLLASDMARNGSIPGMKPGAISPIGLTLYKAALGVLTIMATRTKFPRFADGVAVGTALVVGSDLIKQSGIDKQLSGIAQSAGVGRYLAPSRGMGAYVPGVNPVFTGPAAGFLGGGAPRSRGFGTSLTAGAARNMVSSVADFAQPN